MIEDIDTLVADGAVFCALRRDGDVAKVTPAIFDDVQVFRPIQLGDRFLGGQPTQVGIGRIEK